MSFNPGDSPNEAQIKSTEPTTTPPPQAPYKQSVMGYIISFVFLSAVIGITVFFALRDSEDSVPSDSNGEVSVPTSVPAVIEATLTPTIMPEPTISVESAEKLITVCQVVAAAMLQLNEQGFSEEQTILVVAQKLDITLQELNELLDVCIKFYGNLPVE